MAFNLDPIGRVASHGMTFELQIAEPYRAGLAELDGFSHINVLWWCHYLDAPEYRCMVTAAKPYRQGPDVVGIFATRSPARPNPIAITATALISIDHTAGVVAVGYLDAEDGTPILDLKPYLPATDRVRDVTTPSWCADWPQCQEESATFDWSSVFENAQ
jgi:tRNA-Thr(GGU) m(6)t(6)A37 methyltransferase TsaA